MARVQGGGHSDAITGNLGGVCFRGYRGNNIVSGSRRMTVAKPKQHTIASPLEIELLMARYSADQLVTFRPPVGLMGEDDVEVENEGDPNMDPLQLFEYVQNWGDQVGGIGSLNQLITVRQPKWFDADIDRNNRPYIYGDGVDDRMLSALLVPQKLQPFEIWMVADEPGRITGRDTLYGISDVQVYGSELFSAPSTDYQMRGGNIVTCGQKGNGKVKIWRWVWCNISSFMEWNGVQQTANVNPGAGILKQLTIWATGNNVNWSNFKCFEIDVFGGILPATDRIMLIDWLKSTYNLPA